MLLYLFFLPFALIGGFLLLRGFIEHLKAPFPDEAPIKEITDDDPLVSAKAKTSAAERTFSICLIGAWLNTASGKTAAEILENIDAGVRPEPSEKQKDDDGFPVFLADVKDLDIDKFTETLTSENEGLSALSANTQVTRLLALLNSILPDAEMQTRAQLKKAPANARLNIHWLVPSNIESNHFPAMRSWLNDKHLSEIDKSRVEIMMTPITSEAGALRQVDELVLKTNREKLDDNLILLIAATSAVDEASINSLSIRKRLFSASNQNGQIPGESAVCLLFSSHKTATSHAIDDVVVMSRVSHASRDKSVNAAGKTNGTLIGHLVDGLLNVHSLEASGIQALVSDSDHRANHICEVLAGIESNFEHLDPMKDCLATGTVTGSNLSTGSLLALVCAREKVLMTEGPVLCISNQHDTERAALLTMPFIAKLSTETTST
ncbi:hypothetical protein [Quatrionicoccus australiensis]|uniref:hypothetical protein n=1 Tax=Quatrionicoccus australiensis TaxID=138118 RepID=UPI001CFBF1D9|nr:hypothetical protein [Quatrionicoccus australiensis]MCB4359518.1 hypothetical protein [Quatrionicoccus australiensis]